MDGGTAARTGVSFVGTGHGSMCGRSVCSAGCCDGATVLDDDGWDDPEPILGPLAMTEVTVEVTENPIVATLLGPDGQPLRQWRQRPPFGFVR